MTDKEFFANAKGCKSNKELAKMYNFIMGTNISIDNIRKRGYACGYHIKDNIGTNQLRSPESIEWIKQNKDKYDTTTNLHKAYIEHFDSNVKHASFAYILKKIITPKFKQEYTEQETQWFKDNVHKYFTRLQVKHAFNKEFNKNLTINEINHKIGYMKLHCSRPPKKEKVKKEKVSKAKYTPEKRKKVWKEKAIKNNPRLFSPEQEQWFKDNSTKYSFFVDLYNDFQKKFNSIYSMKQVKYCCQRINAKLTRAHLYTEEEKKWMYDNYNSKFSRRELVKIFEEKFGKELKTNTIKTICNSNGIFKDKENYTDGSLLFALPIGTEKIFNGKVHIKINNIKETNRNKKGNRAYHKNWVRKHKYIWEQANGPIPRGYEVCFRDGNKLNCELSNLYLATHGERCMLSRNKVYGYEEYTEAYLDIIRIEKELNKNGVSN